MIAYLTAGPADDWRIAAAVVAFVVLFSLTLALRLYGHELTRDWRRVLRAVTVQQAVLAYAAYTRARQTPAGFPSQADPSLIALVLSGICLALCVLAVFAGRREDGPQSEGSKA